MKYFIGILLLCLATNLFAQTASRDEFNGPFPSWANVKTRFKAQGNGKADDTRALQAALDSLSTTIDQDFNRAPGKRYVVIYLPAGTYNISNTLTLSGKIGVSFIGEDPSRTIIKWTGGDNDTMFFSNKSAYVKVSRLTWDANNKQGMREVGFHFKDQIAPKFAPTSIELSDMIFTGNPAYGITTGTYGTDGTGVMDAEFAIKRCRFVRCTQAGIQIKGFNALDNWIWDCSFTNCNIGVDCSHGNYHLYTCNFTGSKTTDLKNKDPMYTSVRGCTSKDAGAFSIDEGASCNTFKRVFQGNSVYDCKSTPIQYHHQGKITLVNNYFVNAAVPQKITVDYSSWCNGNYDIMSLENNYQELNPYNLRKDFPSRIFSLSDKKFNAKTMKKPALNTSVSFLPFVGRKVFEVPESANSAAIQKIIDAASALKSRAVVHFGMGTYFFDKSVEVPAGSDIQIAGDGLVYATVLQKKGGDDPNFYFFRVKGPSYITVRDLQLGNDPLRDHTNGFLFTGVDQPSSEVRFDQIYTLSNKTLFINKLDYTYFEKNNSFFANGNRLIGGDKVAAGKGTSKLYCFGGQSALTNLQNNATVVAKDCWWEGSTSKEFTPFNLTGNGNFTLDGAMLAPSSQDSTNVINVSNFKGNISLMNLYLYGALYVSPSTPDLNVLVWNVNMIHKMDPTGFMREKGKYKLAMLGISSQCSKSKNPNCTSEDPRSVADAVINVSNLDAFIARMSKDSQKAMPRKYKNLPAGVSNILISRVSTYTANTGYTFTK
jgi:hypothetical protein